MAVSPPQIVMKSWGMERIIHNGDYCMKLLVYTRECASSLHYHLGKHETFYVAHGTFELETSDGPGEVRLEKRLLYTGDSVVLPSATVHRIRCLQVGTIVEASSHDDPNDCIRLEKSE